MVRCRADGACQRENSERLGDLGQGQPRPGQLWVARSRFAPALSGAPCPAGSPIHRCSTPYRGSVPGVADVIAGQIASMFTPSGDFIPQSQGGQAAHHRHIRAPPVHPPRLTPTFAEQGLGELTTEEWFGFYSPAKTPGNVIDNANAAINAALQDKTVINSLATFGLAARGPRCVNGQEPARCGTTAEARSSNRLGSPNPDHPGSGHANTFQHSQAGMAAWG
ncbi:MAG: hypothetical protein IPI20_09305 [Rhodoferax sp.]|nr:hypothetical protein [Rhodoferax sp.]